MFEEEFLVILYESLKNFLNKKIEIEVKKEFYEQVDRDNEENNRIDFQLIVLNDHINVVKEIVGFPNYSRIKAMSDTELEYYKQNKLNILSTLLSSLTDNISQERRKISNLTIEEKECALRYSVSKTKDDKEKIIKNGHSIREKILKCEKQIMDYTGEVEKYKENLKEINNKSLEEIKNELLDNCDYDEQKIINSLNSTPYMKLLASVSDDFSKAKELSHLLVQYKKKYYVQASINQEKLDEIMKKYNLELSFNNLDFEHSMQLLEKLYDCIQDYKNRLNENDEDFVDIYKKDKLFRFVDAQEGKVNINDIFVMQFSDELNDENELDKCEELEELKESKKDDLNKKRNFLFKKRIYSEIDEIDNNINNIKNGIIAKIAAFYISKSEELNLEPALFKSYNDVNKFLSNSRKYFDEQYESIDKDLEVLESVKSEYVYNNCVLNNQKMDIINNIEDLLGTKITPEDIDLSQISDNEIENLRKISIFSALLYRINVMDIILQQATDLANEKEAKIKGITIEELLNEKANNGKQKIIQKDA